MGSTLLPIREIREAVRAARPLIHCITNPISIHQCANTVLAAGARPMMAEHPDEAAIITRSAGAVMLNLGNLTDVRMQSMRISAQTAAEAGIPVLLDVCGAACLPNRRSYALSLMQAAAPAVVKGNYAEIMALCRSDYRTDGVDDDGRCGVSQLDSAAAELAKRCSTVIAATGETDIVTDGRRLLHIRCGTPQLASVTGTGCMLGALTAAYLSASDAFAAAGAACAVFGICGRLAETDRGSGTFAVQLMDALSTVTEEQLSPFFGEITEVTL